MSLDIAEKLMIDLQEFDPTDCPEPTDSFRIILATIPGLKFFRNISPDQVAEFVAGQFHV